MGLWAGMSTQQPATSRQSPPGSPPEPNADWICCSSAPNALVATSAVPGSEEEAARGTKVAGALAQARAGDELP